MRISTPNNLQDPIAGWCRCVRTARFLFLGIILSLVTLPVGCGSGEGTEKATADKAEAKDATRQHPASFVEDMALEKENPHVLITTNLGKIVVKLHHDRAKLTVENFRKHVEQGYYDGTLFHQVSAGFIIMGGKFGVDYRPKPSDMATRGAMDEAVYGDMANDAGTIAMAHDPLKPNSARTEFFFNLSDNSRLNYREEPKRRGYCVFGRIVEGMDVLETIAASPVRDVDLATGRFEQTPTNQCVVISMEMTDPPTGKPTPR